MGVAAPYAVHAHVKDFLYKSGQEDVPVGGWFGTRGGNYLRGTVIGHGVVPVRACVHILQNAGYDGLPVGRVRGARGNCARHGKRPRIPAQAAGLTRQLQIFAQSLYFARHLG